MTTRRFSFLFLLPFLAAGVAAGGCRNVPALTVEYSPNWPDDYEWVKPETRLEPVDLLFVIDDSPGMADGQARLGRALPALVERLGRVAGGLPDLHVGVISTDLGTAPYDSAGCTMPGGDGGRLLKGLHDSCANPVGQRFVVDVEPRGCEIIKSIVEGQPTTCTTHGCGQRNCDADAFAGFDGTATEPAGLVFSLDEHGCPRCRNYVDEPLAEVLACTTALGTTRSEERRVGKEV